MMRIRTWLLLSALLACACNRLAGTEVGNPEITVAARFGVQDNGPAASVSAMSLKVMGMGWTLAHDSGACWNEPNGHTVDFVSNAQVPLPPVTVRNGDWSEAEMMLQADSGNSTLPDSADFSAWSNPRYIKLVKITGPDTVRTLFELPSGLRIRLGFGKATIDAWRQDHRMTVLVMFDVGKWAAGLGPDMVLTYRQDGRHAPYAILSPGENTAAYEALKALLPKSFMADAADML
ncbi:MAG: hypothetical protein JWO30_4841 [Fibrobacteres bacterium]|nr:hypothetical protein [Fibrobacterota bacterium]